MRQQYDIYRKDGIVMSEPRVERIFGPPGTGKTTALMRRLEQELESGVNPRDITLVAFTRAAANEAKTRAARRFNLDYKELQGFSTIHSLCYRLLGLKRGSVVAFKNLLDFGSRNGYEFTRRSDSMERAEPTLRTLGDYYIAFNDWRRQKMYDTVDEAFAEFPAPISNQIAGSWTLSGVDRFISRYNHWKRREVLIDFTDMLERTIDRELTPDPDIVIVDEVQDNSPLQWVLTDLWAERARRLYLAGDEDQALFGWSGAVPDLFLNHPTHLDTILDQSYRVPGQVHALAQRIIVQNSNRMQKTYRPTMVHGELRQASRFLDCPLEDLGGSVFVLVRNRFLLEGVAEELLYRNIPFHNLRGPDPLRTGKATAAMALAALSNKKPVSAEALQTVMDYLPAREYVGRGFKRQSKALARESPLTELTAEDIGKGFTPLMWEKIHDGSFLDALQFEANERSLIASVLRDGWMEPRFTISTIHGVKGMEADWVIILNDMSGRTYDSYIRDPEAERRVWYVAVTRAKQGVIIVAPQKNYYFKFPVT